MNFFPLINLHEINRHLFLMLTIKYHRKQVVNTCINKISNRSNNEFPLNEQYSFMVFNPYNVWHTYYSFLTQSDMKYVT